MVLKSLTGGTNANLHSGQQSSKGSLRKYRLVLDSERRKNRSHGSSMHRLKVGNLSERSVGFCAKL